MCRAEIKNVVVRDSDGYDLGCEEGRAEYKKGRREDRLGEKKLAKSTSCYLKKMTTLMKSRGNSENCCSQIEIAEHNFALIIDTARQGQQSTSSVRRRNNFIPTIDDFKRETREFLSNFSADIMIQVFFEELDALLKLENTVRNQREIKSARQPVLEQYGQHMEGAMRQLNLL